VTVVSGYLRMLLKERAGPLGENQRRLLDEMEKSCGRLSALLSEMSELGQLEDGRQTLARTEVNLLDLLHDITSDIPAVEDQAIVVLDASAAVGQRAALSGDEARLRRSMAAIVHALRREIIDGARLVVRPDVRSTETGRVAWIVVGAEPIADTLVGAQASSLGPFDEWRGGVGLALPLARRVIELHGGRLLAHSGERQKAGGVIELPLA
jgi:signal transduction histidine kinase